MTPLLLDSAPAVDLRRSTRLPMEVFESIHAFLPRDRDATSPTAAIMKGADGALIRRRNDKCDLCCKSSLHSFYEPGEGLTLKRWCMNRSCDLYIFWHSE